MKKHFQLGRKKYRQFGRVRVSRALDIKMLDKLYNTGQNLILYFYTSASYTTWLYFYEICLNQANFKFKERYFRFLKKIGQIFKKNQNNVKSPQLNMLISNWTKIYLSTSSNMERKRRVSCLLRFPGGAPSFFNLIPVLEQPEFQDFEFCH